MNEEKLETPEITEELIIQAYEQYTSMVNLTHEEQEEVTSNEGVTRVPRYKVDLDEPPEKRWNNVIENTKQEILGLRKEIRQEMKELTGGFIMGLLDTLGSLFSGIANLFVYYGKELSGFAKQCGIPLTEMMLIQFMYEASSCCTSIVINDPKTKLPVHIRTMDWGMEKLKALTIEVEFWKNGAPLYVATTWPGYVGVLTAMKPEAYSVSVNFRVKGDSYWTNLKQTITYCWPIGFLLRAVFESENDYDNATACLRNSNLIAPVYFTCCGVNWNQGCIITRDRSAEVQPWELSKNKHCVQTNIDHWSSDPEWDILYSIRRRKVSRRLLDEMMTTLNYEDIKDPLFTILSTQPMLNDLTVSATWMKPATGELETRLPQSDGSGFLRVENPDPFGGEKRERCTICTTRFLPSANPTGQCGHSGTWHSAFSHCSKIRCGRGLGITNIGKCHWSCCYATKYVSYCKNSGPHAL